MSPECSYITFKILLSRHIFNNFCHLVEKKSKLLRHQQTELDVAPEQQY